MRSNGSALIYTPPSSTVPTLAIVDHPNGASLQIRVKPRSSRSAIVGTHEGILVVALAAPPVEGEANAELIRLLAGVLHTPKTQISLVQGEKSRTKTLRFAQLNAAELTARLEQLHLKPTT